MRKVVLAAIVGAAFFAGTFFTAFSIADAENGGNSAWAKLVARVLALEENPAVSAKYVHLEDDDAGHAVGWDADGGNMYTISDPDVKANSVITVNIDNPNDFFNLDHCAVAAIEENVGFRISCAGPLGGTVEGAALNYSVINP